MSDVGGVYCDLPSGTCRVFVLKFLLPFLSRNVKEFDSNPLKQFKLFQELKFKLYIKLSNTMSQKLSHNQS